MRKNVIQFTVVLFILLFLSSCAPQAPTDRVYGFFSGILHGFVLFFAVIGKLFNADVGIYAQHNTGFFYWLGFLIGLGIWGGCTYGGGRYKRS
ncbi:MAG: hypothetical protein ACHQFX_06570 [Chitinophagales bacterium]